MNAIQNLFVSFWLALSAHWITSHINYVEANSAAIPVYRLPDTTKPVSYNLKIIPNLSGHFNFSGTVSIMIDVLSTTNEILLHCKDMTVRNVSLARGSKEYKSNYLLNYTDELLKITTNENLTAKFTYNLTIKFNGTLNDNMVGFYRSSYRTGKTNR